jgi:hypothetical protein
VPWCRFPLTRRKIPQCWYDEIVALSIFLLHGQVDLHPLLLDTYKWTLEAGKCQDYAPSEEKLRLINVYCGSLKNFEGQFKGIVQRDLTRVKSGINR